MILKCNNELPENQQLDNESRTALTLSDFFDLEEGENILESPFADT